MLKHYQWSTEYSTKIYRVLIGLNVMGVILEASCWQPKKVTTTYSKATHQLVDVNCPAELLMELAA